VQFSVAIIATFVFGAITRAATYLILAENNVMGLFAFTKEGQDLRNCHTQVIASTT
jgi:hypothetical protein